jgi:hypothetical protein
LDGADTLLDGHENLVATFKGFKVPEHLLRIVYENDIVATMYTKAEIEKFILQHGCRRSSCDPRFSWDRAAKVAARGKLRVTRGLP